MKTLMLPYLVTNIVTLYMANAFIQHRLVKSTISNAGVTKNEPKPALVPKTINDHPRHLFVSLDDQLDTDADEFVQRGLLPDVTTVNKRDDFFDFLSKDERICVVKFYASWCKTCKKFDMRYKKYAMKEGDKLDRRGNNVEKGRVRFAEVELKQNLQLCKALGIKKLPYIHIYKAGVGKIDGYVCLPKNFPKLIEDVNLLLDMPDEEIHLEKKMREGSVLGDALVADLNREQIMENESNAART